MQKHISIDAKVYELWDPESRKVIKSRDIKVINKFILTTDQIPIAKEDCSEKAFKIFKILNI